MKRYIFLSAMSMLFFNGMNFGMLEKLNQPRMDKGRFILDQIVSIIDRDQKTLKKPSQQIVVYQNNALLKMVSLYLQNQNKSQFQVRIPQQA